MARIFKAGHRSVDEHPDELNGIKMVLQRSIPVGARVLQIEKLTISDQVFREVRQTILATTKGDEEDMRLFPVIGSLVHRPKELPANYGKLEVVALIEEKIWEIAPQDCPLCKIGSSRFNPETEWAELIRR